MSLIQFQFIKAGLNKQQAGNQPFLFLVVSYWILEQKLKPLILAVKSMKSINSIEDIQLIVDWIDGKELIMASVLL